MDIEFEGWTSLAGFAFLLIFETNSYTHPPKRVANPVILIVKFTFSNLSG